MAENATTGPPLTLENILKAVQGMTWKRLAEVLLHTAYSQSHFKVDEIKRQSKSSSDRLHDVIEHWLQGDGKDSRPSWRTLIWRLDNENETRVADSIRQFAEPVLDPTLTVENVAEVMEMVVNWEGVGVGLGIPYSKQEEIIQQSLIERVKSNALVQYWVNTDPDASWKKLARVLYWRGEERAAATVRQYMPKDPTLTVENVTKVMGEVENWWAIGTSLHVLHLKLKEIKYQFCAMKDKSHALGEYWIKTDPDASWENLASQLYMNGEGRAATIAKQFLPSDPTLNTENVMEVMEKVVNWVEIGRGLGIPHSKRLEIKNQSSTEKEKSCITGEYWINTDPDASWEKLTWELYDKGEKKAAAMAKQFLPKDPTLTTDNLMEVVKEMERHWQDLCDKLGLQSDGALGMADMVNNYVRHHPTPSWKEVARALQELELHELADTVTTKYVKVSERSRELFDKAMTYGYVEARDIKALIFGAAGTGKTHTIALLMDEEPPTVRCSTPCVAKPIRAVSRTRIELKGEKWVRVTHSELSKTIADASTMIPSKPFPVTQLATTSNTQTALQTPNPQSGHQDHTVKHTSFAKENASACEKLPSVSDLSTEDELLRCIEMSPYSHRAKRAFKRDRIRLIDTGGQPQFHEVLPIFMHGTSASMFAVKLDDSLDDHPIIEFYNDSGQLVGVPYRSHFTNRQILMRCMRVIQSQAFQSEEGLCPMPIFVGTHMDLEHMCPETRKEKNRKLYEMLLPAVQDEAIFYGEGLKELIFPVNAKTPGPHEQEVATELRKVIVKRSRAKPKHIPLRWHALELALQKLMLELGRGVLSKAECLAVAQRFHFNIVSFDEALKYLNNLNTLFYRKDVLPGVICDPQVLLDKVTELVEYNHRLQTDPIQCKATEGKLRKFRDYGIITLEFLSKEDFKGHYVQGIFGPVELLEIFKKLLIVSPITEEHYLMPCLLPVTDDPMLLCPSSSVPSLLFHFPDGPLVGVFCALVAFLLSQAKWKLLLNTSSRSPARIDRNTIQFEVPGDLPGKITLNDSFFTYFQVSIQLPMSAPAALYSKICPQIRENIMEGLCRASAILHYYNSPPKYGFLCCEHSSSNASIPHAAVVDSSYMLMTCTLNPADVCSSLTEKHLVWFGSSHCSGTPCAKRQPFSKMSDPGSEVITAETKPRIAQLMRLKTTAEKKVEIIKSITPQWKQLGLLMDFDDEGRTVDLIETEHQMKGQAACCQEVFKVWLKGPDATWGNLIELLIDCDQKALAEQVKDAVGL